MNGVRLGMFTIVLLYLSICLLQLLLRRLKPRMLTGLRRYKCKCTMRTPHQQATQLTLATPPALRRQAPQRPQEQAVTTTTALPLLVRLDRPLLLQDRHRLPLQDRAQPATTTVRHLKENLMCLLDLLEDRVVIDTVVPHRTLLQGPQEVPLQFQLDLREDRADISTMLHRALLQSPPE